jgi:hypothetical protein
MTFDSWSAIDSGDSAIRNRKITTVVLGRVLNQKDSGAARDCGKKRRWNRKSRETRKETRMKPR